MGTSIPLARRVRRDLERPRARAGHREVALAAIEGGATAVQLRAKELDRRAARPLAEELAARCRAAGVLFVVNDRVACHGVGRRGPRRADRRLAAVRERSVRTGARDQRRDAEQARRRGRRRRLPRRDGVVDPDEAGGVPAGLEGVRDGRRGDVAAGGRDRRDRGRRTRPRCSRRARPAWRSSRPSARPRTRSRPRACWPRS